VAENGEHFVSAVAWQKTPEQLWSLGAHTDITTVVTANFKVT